MKKTLVLLVSILLLLPCLTSFGFAGNKEDLNARTDNDGEVIINALGSTTEDLVYTPIPPCRIVDTRLITNGYIPAYSSVSYYAWGSVAAQGGNAAGCGVLPNASAVAITLTSTQAAGVGNLRAFPFGGVNPTASVLNYTAGVNIANTTILPLCTPSCNKDFTIYANMAGTHFVADVVGYFAAPVATPLNCTVVKSALVAVPVNTWTAIDASCSAGYYVAGGGYDIPEGSTGRPDVWVDTQPLSPGNGWRTWVDNQASGPRNVQTWANCCRVPGR